MAPHQQHDPNHQHHQHQRRPDNTAGVSDPELAGILSQIAGPDGAFRHRQHVNLVFLAVRRHGMPKAVDKVCQWIRQIAVYERHPQKYHHTVSRAWVELIAHHLDADPACVEFDRFAQRHPALLDKRLLTRHYRSSTLASPHARRSWTEPDLLPFPWAERARADPAQADQDP